MIHVTSSWGEPRFSSPSCCAGAGAALLGRQSGALGKGDRDMGGGWSTLQSSTTPSSHREQVTMETSESKASLVPKEQHVCV